MLKTRSVLSLLFISSIAGAAEHYIVWDEAGGAPNEDILEVFATGGVGTTKSVVLQVNTVNGTQTMTLGGTQMESAGSSTHHRTSHELTHVVQQGAGATSGGQSADVTFTMGASRASSAPNENRIILYSSVTSNFSGSRTCTIKANVTYTDGHVELKTLSQSGVKSGPVWNKIYNQSYGVQNVDLLPQSMICN